MRESREEVIMNEDMIGEEGKMVWMGRDRRVGSRDEGGICIWRLEGRYRFSYSYEIFTWDIHGREMGSQSIPFRLTWMICMISLKMEEGENRRTEE